MSLLPPATAPSVRFGQILCARLRSDGLDPRDWLWFHPDESSLKMRDESALELMDLRRSPQPGRPDPAALESGVLADFAGAVLPALRERLLALVVGGFGSHLVAAKVLEEADAFNGQEPWLHRVDYGSSLSTDGACARRAAERIRAILESEAKGRQALVIAHSRGANIALELLTRPEWNDIRERTWGVLSFAGAIGGSPAADTLLARVLGRTRGAPGWIKRGLGALSRFFSRRGSNPMLTGLPTLGELPDGVEDLGQKRRHAVLNRLRLPGEIRFYSISGVIERERARPARLLWGNLDRTLMYLATFELSRHSVLNDTQLLLPDTKWPAGPRSFHLGTIRADHWGLVYRQVLPGSAPDPTPRAAILESALRVIAEDLAT